MQKYIMTVASIFIMVLIFAVYRNDNSFNLKKDPIEKKTLNETILDSDKVKSSVGGQIEAQWQTVSRPNNIPVLVNKDFALPANYKPTDLIYPDVPFLFEEKIEKRMMRKEAAHALEELFQAAEQDGIFLAGVSAYRSHSTQAKIYQENIERDGFEVAATYSAFPGTSEHETGLAIDVSGSSGTCATVDCFGGTEEAEWLENHAHEHGFIVRYPKGKQSITGYKYEPWHLRYVGVSIAEEITNKGITLEEYTNAVPVAN